MLGNILTPLDFSSIAFFTEKIRKQNENISLLNLIEGTYSSQIIHHNNTTLYRNRLKYKQIEITAVSVIIQIHIYKNTTIYHGFFKQTLSGFVILLSQVSLGRKKIKTHPNHMCGFPFFAAAHGKNLKHFLKLIYCIVQYIIYTYLRTPSFKCDIHICFYLIHSSVVDMFLVPFPKEIKAIGSQYVTFFGSPNLLNIQGNLN